LAESFVATALSCGRGRDKPVFFAASFAFGIFLNWQSETWPLFVHCGNEKYNSFANEVFI
jgi:hypothetical protein